MITEGHAVAEGCDLSVLLGQPDYYPRFGYRIQTYGEEIAAAAVYLASDEAGFIHGATLALNGGRVSA